MPRDNQQAALRDTPLFAVCSKREERAFAKLTTVIDVAAATELTRQGAAGHEFVIILSGVASVLVDGRCVATLGAGDHFGEMSLLDDGPRTASVVAETPMRIAVVARWNFAALLEQVPTIARSVLTGLARRVRSSEVQAA
jgi:CRP/FNR family transcriptional regulator, cyclic AMP receptor protein